MAQVFGPTWSCQLLFLLCCLLLSTLHWTTPL